MKVGDVVRFNDVSSFADKGHGSFPGLTGTLAIVVTCITTVPGRRMTTVMMNGEIKSFHPDYFKEVLSEGW